MSLACSQLPRDRVIVSRATVVAARQSWLRHGARKQQRLRSQKSLKPSLSSQFDSRVKYTRICSIGHRQLAHDALERLAITSASNALSVVVTADAVQRSKMHWRHRSNTPADRDWRGETSSKRVRFTQRASVKHHSTCQLS